MIPCALGVFGLLMVASCAATAQTPPAARSGPAIGRHGVRGVTVARAAADDHEAAVMYVQSFMAPAMLEVCKGILPNGAARLDGLLAQWREKNQPTLAQGERDLRAAGAGGGAGLDAMLASRRESLVRELRAMPPAGRAERCVILIDILEQEAR